MVTYSLFQVEEVFKALADRVRRNLLDQLLRENGQTLGQLCEGIAMSRQAISKHLMILEKAGLVVVRWKGRNKYHYLNPVPINEISERWISKFDEPRVTSLAELKKELEKENGE